LSAAGQVRHAFPWEELARFAFTVLRLTPQAFWLSTPRELALALHAFGAPSQPPDRSALEHLMHQHPD
jgi:uncharacterized phage protein (TIGR02216 family)